MNRFFGTTILLPMRSTGKFGSCILLAQIPYPLFPSKGENSFIALCRLFPLNLLCWASVGALLGAEEQRQLLQLHTSTLLLLLPRIFSYDILFGCRLIFLSTMYLWDRIPLTHS